MEPSPPEEYGKRLAKQANDAIQMQMPSIQMSAAVLACLHQLLALLIHKGVIEPQETLDAFARASDDIQLQPDSDLAVQIVEGLCSFVAKLPGARRDSA
jgi:hypothetical protein